MSEFKDLPGEPPDEEQLFELWHDLYRAIYLLYWTNEFISNSERFDEARKFYAAIIEKYNFKDFR